MTQTPKPKKPKSKRRTPGLNREQAEELYARLAEDRPEPQTELNYSNPYTLVVAVALSAQATDVGVNKATDKLFKVADTPEKMLALGEDGVREHIAVGERRSRDVDVDECGLEHEPDVEAEKSLCWFASAHKHNASTCR